MFYDDVCTKEKDRNMKPRTKIFTASDQGNS